MHWKPPQKEIEKAAPSELPKSQGTDLGELVTRIRNELGCSKELAAAYASDIGDKPEIEHQKIIIRNGSRRIIARLPVSVLG